MFRRQVFGKGSLLAVDVSEAVLKLTQSGHVDALEQNMLHLSNCSSSYSSSSAPQEADDIRLGPGPFSGLFLILGCILGFAFFVAMTRLVRTRWTSVRSLVRQVMLTKRNYMWASNVVEMNMVRHHVDVVPTAVVSEVALHHR